MVTRTHVWRKLPNPGDPGIYKRRVQTADVTPTQREILHYLAQGLTNKQVAKARGTNLNAVYYSLGKLKERTGALTTEHLMAIAFRKGWLR